MFCPKCGAQNSDTASFCVSCGAPLKPSAQPIGDTYSSTPPPQNRPASGAPPKNWMTEAILATVFGFLFSCLGGIFGIVAIVSASNVNKRFQQGDIDGAAKAASQAKTWTIVAAVITVIGFIITFFVYGVASLAAIMGG